MFLFLFIILFSVVSVMVLSILDAIYERLTELVEIERIAEQDYWRMRHPISDAQGIDCCSTVSSEPSDIGLSDVW